MQPCDTGRRQKNTSLAPLSVAETRRLVNVFAPTPRRTVAFKLAWSNWRRAKRYQAKQSHYASRLRKPAIQSILATFTTIAAMGIDLRIAHNNLLPTDCENSKSAISRAGFGAFAVLAICFPVQPAFRAAEQPADAPVCMARARSECRVFRRSDSSRCGC